MKCIVFYNGWFIEDNQQEVVWEIVLQMFNWDWLQEWLFCYELIENSFKKVGIVMAGNILLVGFYDWFCVFVVGYIVQVKLLEKDFFFFLYLMKILECLDECILAYIEVIDCLQGFDVVIVIGSNNFVCYFEVYFLKYFYIICKNWNGVVVLIGDEMFVELQELGKDIFWYYGLGCCNVVKLYVLEGYDFDFLLEVLYEYWEVVFNMKYKNNFDYNYVLFIFNKIEFKVNGCILLV